MVAGVTSYRHGRRRRALASALLASLLAGLSPLGTRAEAQDLTDVSALMKLSLEELLDVKVTSATKGAQSLREAPAVMTVITAQQIKERGYQSVGEALQSVPGMDVLHDHYQYNLGVRGISPGSRAWSRTVKVMIDGQPVSFRATQENWLGEELIPMLAIERIEVIKGPASVLYGANAYLGVINIITKNGKDIQGAELGARHNFGSNISDPQAQAVAGVEAGKWDAIGAANFNSPADTGYKLVNLPDQHHPLEDEKSQSGRPLNGSGFAKLSYRTENYGTLTLDFNYDRLDRYSEFMDWGVMAHDNRQSLEKLYARLKYSKTFLDSVDWNVGATYAQGGPTRQDHLNVADHLTTHVERKFGYQSVDVFTDLTYRYRDLVRIALNSDYTQDQQTLLNYYTVSANGMRQLNPPAGTHTGTRPFSNVGASVHGIFTPFANFQAQAIKSLQLSGGVRFDHQNIYGDNVNYSAALVDQLTENLYAKLLFGTSFRAPAASQLYSNFIETEGAIGNPKLRPERAQTLELALGGSFLEHFTLEADGFLTTIKSKVETRPPPPAGGNIGLDNDYPQNHADIKSMGAEASLTAYAENFSSYLNYSYQHSSSSEQNLYAVMAGAKVKSSALQYPSHMVKLGANYKIPAAYMQANAEARYIGSRLGSESNNELVYGSRTISSQHYGLDSYVLVDVFVSTHELRLWGQRETRVAFGVTNLLGTNYTFPGYNGFDIPGFARTYRVSLSQQF